MRRWKPKICKCILKNSIKLNNNSFQIYHKILRFNNKFKFEKSKRMNIKHYPIKQLNAYQRRDILMRN